MWAYTPREIVGWIEFIADGERHDMARDLSVGALAARGDPKDVKRRLKEWTKD